MVQESPAVNQKDPKKFPMQVANEVHRMMVGEIPENYCPPVMSNDQLMGLGKMIWEHTYKLTQRDDDAFNLAFNLAEALTRVNPDMGLAYRSALVIPHEQMRIMWAARWVDQGCPRFVVDGPFAALLMSTDAGPEVAELVVPPWKAFLIEIPLGILPCHNDRTGKTVYLRRVFAQHVITTDGNPVWNLVAEGEDGLQLWRHGVRTEQLLYVDKGDAWQKEDASEFLQDMESQDERNLLMVGRLIVSMCLSLSDPTVQREQKKTKGRGASKFRLNKDGPEIRTFVIGRPVSIDCRQTVRDYVEGKKRGGRVTVQFLVRGHWRNQPHGPGNSLRKVIHIEPYWKGPEDGKLVAKAMNVTGGVGR